MLTPFAKMDKLYGLPAEQLEQRPHRKVVLRLFEAQALDDDIRAQLAVYLSETADRIEADSMGTGPRNSCAGASEWQRKIGCCDFAAVCLVRQIPRVRAACGLSARCSLGLFLGFWASVDLIWAS